LRLHIRAAYDDGGRHAAASTEFLNRGQGLQRELSRRRQDQRLRLPFRQCRKPLDHRNDERRSFSRPGLRTNQSHHVRRAPAEWLVAGWESVKKTLRRQGL